MSFFRPRKPRPFMHKPIYWDPRKEEMEKRKQRIIKAEDDADDLSFRKEQIKGRFIHSSAHVSKKHQNNSSGNSLFKWKTISAIIVFILLLYFLYIR